MKKGLVRLVVVLCILFVCIFCVTVGCNAETCSHPSEKLSLKLNKYGNPELLPGPNATWKNGNEGTMVNAGEGGHFTTDVYYALQCKCGATIRGDKASGIVTRNHSFTKLIRKDNNQRDWMECSANGCGAQTLVDHKYTQYVKGSDEYYRTEQNSVDPTVHNVLWRAKYSCEHGCGTWKWGESYVKNTESHTYDQIMNKKFDKYQDIDENYHKEVYKVKYKCKCGRPLSDKEWDGTKVMGDPIPHKKTKVLKSRRISCDPSDDGTFHISEYEDQWGCACGRAIGTWVEGDISFEPHEYKDATCTSPQRCICGKTQGEKLGHKQGSWTTTKAATCTTAGKKEWKCTRTGCTYIESETIPSLSHNYAAATCTSPQKCTRCGKLNGSALGHKFYAWHTTKSATCTATGTKERNCTVCGYVEKGTLPVLGHKFGNWTTKRPACHPSGGYQERTCSRCNKVEKQNLAKTNHSFYAWHTTKSAGCYVDGTKERNCTVCGYIEKGTIPAGHYYKNGVCTRCGKKQ